MTINNFSYVDEIIRCAKDSLTKPEDFGYWGPEDTFVTWGFCGIDKHRDSPIMDISNFECITKELMLAYPNDFRIEEFGHWLVGNVERLVCRVLKDGTEINYDNITDAYKSVMNCKDMLSDYPVYNEDDYQNKLYEAAIDSLNNLPNYLKDMIDLDKPDYAGNIYHELTVNMGIEFDVDGEQYPSDDDIKTAVYYLQYWNTEAIEEWNEFTDQNGLERIRITKVHPDQLKLFED